MKENLNNQVVLVTGGAQGLGKAICSTLSGAGARVIIGDIQADKGLALAESLQADGRDALFKQLDVSDEENVEAVVQSIESQHGRLDILINNAGIDFTKPISQLSVAEWDAAIRVNLRGPFLTSKFALQIMTQQKSGYILNITSTAALRAWSEASAYHASKWGLRGFTHALFTEARRVNVKVTALVAGGMRTPFLLDRFPDIEQRVLQDPINVARHILNLLLDDSDTVVPELMVIPGMETSWP